ncbi:MAG: hypothetical protein ACQKBY_10130 [Verrucomicrobiales bacterium]
MARRVLRSHDARVNDGSSRALLFPPAGGKGLRLRRKLAPPPRPAPWPWKATMLTAVNCYLLVVLFWLCFVVSRIALRHPWVYNLDFYNYGSERFAGLNVPELFLVAALALSLFAFASIMIGTGKTPGLWKRLLCVSLFAALAVGLPLLILAGRRHSYEFARERAYVFNYRYQAELVRHYDELDHENHSRSYLSYYEVRLKRLEGQIARYHARYGVPEDDQLDASSIDFSGHW